MSDMKIVISVLRWITRNKRTREEASSRWGHYYDDARDEGLVIEHDREVVMNGHYRDLRTPISLTDKGRALLR